MKFNNWWHFLLLVGFYFAFTYLFNTYLQNDRVIIESLSGKYSNKVITNYLQTKNNWAWLGYLLVPVLILFRTTLISFFMQMVLYFQHLDDEDEKLPSFGKYWSVVLFAEWLIILFMCQFCILNY